MRRVDEWTVNGLTRGGLGRATILGGRSSSNAVLISEESAEAIVPDKTGKG
jgi:hypothetical protein